MADNMSEQEQIELLKRLWNEYGYPVLAGVSLALIGWFVWYGWNNHLIDARQSASSIYQDLMPHDDALDGKKIIDSGLVDRMKIEYADQFYYLMTLMHVANSNVKSGSLELAEKSYADIMQIEKDSIMRILTELRMARVAYENSDFDNALRLLDGIGECDYMKVDCAELRGDSYKAAGRFVDAEKFYQQAIVFLGEYPDEQKKNNIQMKLYDMKINKAALLSSDAK